MRILLMTLFAFYSLAAWASLPRNGVYSLVSGTQGCPDAVEVVQECDGLTLTPMTDGAPGASERFCHIGKGLKKEHISQKEKKHRHVKWEDGRLHKQESQILSEKADSVEFASEDFIIPSQEQTFLWDHSHMTNGFSCLYQ